MGVYFAERRLGGGKDFAKVRKDSPCDGRLPTLDGAFSPGKKKDPAREGGVL